MKLGTSSLAAATVLVAWPSLSALARPTPARSKATDCALARSMPRVTTIPFVSGASADVRRPGTAAPPTIRAVADIPLPGRPVRFDYQTEDSSSGRLYLSHMYDAHIEVFDTRSQRIVRRIPDTPGVTGVWVVPRIGKLYASVTGDHRVAIYSTSDLELRRPVGPIGFPDGIAFAPGAGRVFVSDESGGGELVIDGAGDSAVARIPLGGEAGNTKYDAGSGCVLVAVQTLDQVVAIDPASLRVVARFQLAGAAHPHGMVLDDADRLLFVANEGNATVEVVDLTALTVVADLPVGDDPDVLAFDPARRRLYVATESGGLWVYHLVGRSLRIDGALALPHAHTVSVDPATHRVYLPLQDLHGHPVLRILVDAGDPN